MGTVLSTTVPVCGERFPAAGAGEGVDRLSVDLLRVGIPPCLSASGRTELDPLDAVTLGEGLSASETDGKIIRRALGIGAVTGKAVPLAVTLYGAYGDTERICDRNIAIILLPEPADHGFLFIGHASSSILRGLSLSTHWTKLVMVVRP
jgi:hypothetical protein